MKYLRTTAVLTALSLAAIAAPAFAQTTTPTPTPTPTCQTGNMCPGQSSSSISIGANAIFGGKAAGAFGAFNQQGQPVTDSTLQGKVELAKTGGAESDIKLKVAGCALTVTCPTTQVEGTIRAWEVAGAKVTAVGSTPGNAYVIQNQGQAFSGVGYQVNVQLPSGN